MMKEQGNILNREAKTNPFIVPEGYFDNLTARVMANVAAADNQSVSDVNVVSLSSKKRNSWLQWTGAVAACITVALVAFNVLHTSVDTSVDKLANTATQSQEIYDQQYQEDMLRYAMVDYNDVYCYLSGVNE